MLYRLSTSARHASLDVIELARTKVLKVVPGGILKGGPISYVETVIVFFLCPALPQLLS